MKILTVLTYYRPHTSGLTIYAERLARAFAKRGHEVTVMTTQYDPSLPREETMDGVKIIRVPVMARVSKGVIAPLIGFVATKLVASHDVVQMHLPQFTRRVCPRVPACWASRQCLPITVICSCRRGPSTGSSIRSWIFKTTWRAGCRITS